MNTILLNNDGCEPIIQTIYNVDYVQIYDSKNANRCTTSFDTIENLKTFIKVDNITPIRISKTTIIIVEEEINI